MSFLPLFTRSKILVGMIHVRALPGTPRHRPSRLDAPLDDIFAQATASPAWAPSGMRGTPPWKPEQPRKLG